MSRIVFATCSARPDIQSGDALVAKALEARGAIVAAAPWNGPQDAFEAADAVVVRSTWDYQTAPDAFAVWLAAQERASAVFNPPALMRWNMSKRYLLELALKGAPLPPTRLIEPSAAAIEAAMAAMGLDEAVVKPEFGATGSGLSRVVRGDAAGLAAAAEKMAMSGVVQALVPEIASRGETSFIFIDGDFSHAVVKRPKSGEILCQAEHGGLTQAASPPGSAVDTARAVLEMTPQSPLYARIDAILLDGRMQLMELEVIEPELFFTYCPEAADRFAAALLKRL